jgi:hypothetical protein
MPRTKTPAPEAEILDPAGEAQTAQALAVVREAEQATALAVSQHDAAVRAVATQVGYALPADCADPDLIQRDIAANMRRSVEACLEVGRGLRVLKEACAHGEFVARLDVLGIDKYVASRFMQSATKFSKLPTSATLKALGNQSKLFEMLVLDDEQIEELELTGQTGELSLDDVATMSVKELRAKLRELKNELKATEEISAEKTQRIERLQREVKLIAAAAPDKVLADLQTESTRIGNDLRGGIVGQLRQALVALHEHGDSHGTRPTVFMSGLVGQLLADLVALRDEFDLPAIDANEHGWIDPEGA